MDDDVKTGLALFGGLMLGFLVLTYAVVVGGWTLTILWRWFVVPIFPVAPLSVMQAAGLMLLISFVWHRSELKKDERPTDWANVFFAFTLPFWILLFGWLVHLCIR